MKEFNQLLDAILADDRAGAKQLLKENRGLALATAASPHLYPRIHWMYKGDSALHLAAASFRCEIARLLLDAGADPNAAKNHRRSTPLHYACDGHCNRLEEAAGSQPGMIRLLLEAGADLHARDANGATPLHRAVRTRSAEAVRTLLAAGADGTVRNKPGSTAFHLAVQNTGRGGSGSEEAKEGQREIIALFLKAGLKPTLKDERGRSVLEWARTPAIRELLHHSP